MEINKSLVKDPGKCLTPVYISGESYSLYMNGDIPFTDPNWNLFDLQIIPANGGAAVASSFAQLFRAFPFGGASPAYHLYSTFPMPHLPNGQYRFTLYHFGQDAIKLTTNVILVENDITDRTVYVEYRNTFNKYGVLFEDIPDFKHRFRLPIAQEDLQFEVERKQYRNVTDRRLRNITSYRDALLKLAIIHFDDDGYEALTAMFEHNQVNIDGYDIEPKAGVTIDGNSKTSLRTGHIEVYVSNADNQYNFWNGYGNNVIYTGTANYSPDLIYSPI